MNKLCDELNENEIYEFLNTLDIHSGSETPIHKSGNKTIVCNYRPNSKLSVILKVFKAIITKIPLFIMSQQLSTWF